MNMKTFEEYQLFCESNAQYLNVGNNLIYPILGLCARTGSLADKINKIQKDGGFDRDAMISEIGEVLWFLSTVSSEMGLNLSDIAKKNIEKLSSKRRSGASYGLGEDK
jgi:NTP pyrophosphatase (non-canonical NTP hydrolase)